MPTHAQQRHCCSDGGGSGRPPGLALRSARCISSRLYLATAASPLLPSSSCDGGEGPAGRRVRHQPAAAAARQAAAGAQELMRRGASGQHCVQQWQAGRWPSCLLHLCTVGAPPRVRGQRVDALTAVELQRKMGEAIRIALGLGSTLRGAAWGGSRCQGRPAGPGAALPPPQLLPPPGWGWHCGRGAWACSSLVGRRRSPATAPAVQHRAEGRPAHRT